MVHNKYDAWDLENANSPTMVRPLSRSGWFITNNDFKAYDTLACVDNLVKSCENGDMITEDEIISLQSMTPSDLDIVGHRSSKLKRRIKKSK